MSEGFNFRNKDHAWEKVSQKWRNMERTYRMHVQNLRSKGLPLGSITMEFFDDLHELLAGKYHTESMLSMDSSSSFDLSNPGQTEDDETRASMEMTNGELVEYYTNDEEQQEEEEEESPNSSEQGPILMEAELCYDTYVEDEIPQSPTFSDNKNLVFTTSDQEIDVSSDPHTAGVRDPRSVGCHRHAKETRQWRSQWRTRRRKGLASQIITSQSPFLKIINFTA
jgi:hypothetical protein